MRGFCRSGRLAELSAPGVQDQRALQAAEKASRAKNFSPTPAARLASRPHRAGGRSAQPQGSIGDSPAVVEINEVHDRKRELRAIELLLALELVAGVVDRHQDRDRPPPRSLVLIERNVNTHPNGVGHVRRVAGGAAPGPSAQALEAGRAVIRGPHPKVRFRASLEWL
jgi:hypothetical protein